MPLLKSQVCILIEVFGGDFTRYADFTGFVKLIIEPADNTVICTSGDIQDFSDVRCR